MLMGKGAIRFSIPSTSREKVESVMSVTPRIWEFLFRGSVKLFNGIWLVLRLICVNCKKSLWGLYAELTSSCPSSFSLNTKRPEKGS